MLAKIMRDKMRNAKFVKNPAGTDTLKITCNFSIHDTLRAITVFKPTLLRSKMYFDLYFSTNKKSSFAKSFLPKYAGRTIAEKVQKSSK